MALHAMSALQDVCCRNISLESFRHDMIWLFEREGKRACLEVLYLAANSYEVRFIDANGVEHVEHWSTATDAGNRQLEVEHTLAAQGWEKTGGWKL